MILSRTILLVEDSDSDRLLFSRYIKQMGYECMCMDSAEKLISQINGMDSSIILMDIEMPGITGLEAIEILKKRETVSGKKHLFIALTAHTDDNIQSIVAEAGFDDYLQKPISKRELKSRLVRYLPEETEVNKSELNTYSVMENSDGKLYSLDMFDVDEPEFIRSIVEMFVNNTPVTLAQIKEAYEKDDMDALRQQAHKLKPHFGFFGALGIQQAMQVIEDIGRGISNKKKLSSLIESIEKESSQMINQMKTDLLS